MIEKLMQINSLQEDIIRSQANAIDELYILLCEAMEEDAEKLTPLFYSLQDIADRSKRI